jgi:hypothetical protein
VNSPPDWTMGKFSQTARGYIAVPGPLNSPDGGRRGIARYAEHRIE